MTVATVATRYVDREGAALAYQVAGDGPVDVLTFYEFMLHLDLCWMDPDTHHNMQDLARFARSAAVQRRGVGLSDRVDYVPTVEQQADDVLAVMDAIGMQQATLVGILGTCGPVALAAAKAPSRVTGLVLLSPIAQGPGVADPVGWSEAEASDWMASADHAVAHWGDGALVDLWDPVLASTRNRRLMGLLERSSATPAAARAHYDWLVQIDLQDVFRAVQVPTRVLCTPSSRIPEAAVRHVADLVPDATFHTMPHTSVGASLGQSFAPVAGHVEQLATGSGRPADADRFLGAVLFTDVVSSTELLASLGDAAYRDLRATHERRVRLAVEDAGGSLVNVAGDGTLSVFDGPRDAVRSATRITDEALADGLRVRSGVHFGRAPTRRTEHHRHDRAHRRQGGFGSLTWPGARVQNSPRSPRGRRHRLLTAKDSKHSKGYPGPGNCSPSTATRHPAPASAQKNPFSPGGTGWRCGQPAALLT